MKPRNIQAKTCMGYVKMNLFQQGRDKDVTYSVIMWNADTASIICWIIVL